MRKRSQVKRRNRRRGNLKWSAVKMRAAQLFLALIMTIGILAFGGGMAVTLWKAWELDRFIEEQIQRLEARARR